jgi:hypothetical protein
MTTDDWRLSEYRPKGTQECWFFRKNLAPAITPGHRRYPWLVYLTLTFTPRDVSGLPSQDDVASLYKAEEDLLAVLESRQLAVQVAAVMKPGVRDLLFYTRDPEAFLKRALAFRNTVPQFSPACEVVRDPAWSHYEDFP